MSEKLGTAVLDLTADASSLTRTVGAAQLATVRGFRDTAKKSKMAMVAGMAAVGVAVGVGLYKVGKEFDAAYDKIRVGTGATGKRLEGLKESFRNVVKDVPADFDDAGDAIADVNTRLGLTGKPLEARTKQFLELSRITGTDVKSNIEAVSKAFVDWEVPVKNQGRVLDGFFRISQETGIGVDELARSVQEFGSPLRQLGFTLEESAAMFGTFEKAGVNTSTMVPGLKLAISNLTRPTGALEDSMKKLGIAVGDPEKALKQVMRIMNDDAIPTAEKTGLAMDVFGRRAGADMAEAIKQGRFEFDDLVDVMKNGEDTIMGAGEETMDFSEKLKILRNKGMVALEKPAMAVFDGLTKLADVLIFITEAIEKIPSPIKKFVGVLALATAGIATFVFALGKAKAAWLALRFLLLANPYVALIAATIAIATLIVKNWDAIKKFLAKTWAVIKKGAAKAWAAIKKALAKAWEAIKKGAEKVFELIRAAAEYGLLGPLPLIIARWKDIRNFLKRLWEGIRDVAKKVWSGVHSAIVNPIKAADRWLTNAVRNIAGWIRDRWRAIRQFTAELWGRIKDAITNPIRNARQALRNVIGDVASWLRARWRSIRDTTAEFWSSIRQRITNPIGNAVEWVKTALRNLTGWLRDRWNAIRDGAGAFASQMKSRIENAFKGAVNAVIGFVKKIGKVVGKIPGVSNPVKGLKKLAKGGMVSRAGVEGLAQGGLVNRPMAIVGEEAPRHPEFVIPTNPAYRGRAMMLTDQLMRHLGMGDVPHYAIGGVIKAAKKAVSAPLGMLGKGASFFLGKLPKPSDFLPGWLSGLGKHVLGKVTSWIKDKVGSAVGIGGGKVTAQGSSALDRIIGPIAKAFGLVMTSGFRGGDPGWHGKNRARDYSNSSGPTPEMMGFARYVASKFGKGLLELIYTPLGFSIKNGQITAPFAQAAHYNHVHVAMAKGGVLPFVGNFHSGGVAPQEGLAHVAKGEPIGGPLINIEEWNTPGLDENSVAARLGWLVKTA